MEPSKFAIMAQKFRELFDSKSRSLDPEFLKEVKDQQSFKHRFTRDSATNITAEMKCVMQVLGNYETYLDRYLVEHKRKSTTTDHVLVYMIAEEKKLVKAETESFTRVADYFKLVLQYAETKASKFAKKLKARDEHRLMRDAVDHELSTSKDNS